MSEWNFIHENFHTKQQEREKERERGRRRRRFSILQSQFTEKGFKKAENSKQNVVTVVFTYTKEEEEERSNSTDRVTYNCGDVFRKQREREVRISPLHAKSGLYFTEEFCVLSVFLSKQSARTSAITVTTEEEEAHPRHETVPAANCWLRLPGPYLYHLSAQGVALLTPN